MSKSALSRAPNSGFTLIELVMVIVILGVLAAFALPRFADLSSSARQAKMEGVYGVMQSAASIVSMACKTNTACNPSAPSADGGLGNAITLEGASITLAYGYPRRTEAGIARASGVQDESDGGDYHLSQSNASSVERLRVRPDGDMAVKQCEVLYREAESAGQSPEITLITTNC
ncbi:type II secretion system protein [Marinobacter gelidimuriae]|uniref:type II secretion system protein n=1 Tax=Marinobacter gelidimuriae TaxID=2739064 RepID=UPI0009DB0C98|nr:type II secretion system protein [Marinobacter gelidimuriae]